MERGFLRNAFRRFTIFVDLFGSVRLAHTLFFGGNFAKGSRTILYEVRFRGLNFGFLSSGTLREVGRARVPLKGQSGTTRKFGLCGRTSFSYFSAFTFGQFPLIGNFLDRVPIYRTIGLSLKGGGHTIFFRATCGLRAGQISCLRCVFGKYKLQVKVFVGQGCNFNLMSRESPNFIVNRICSLPFCGTTFICVRIRFFLFRRFVRIFRGGGCLLCSPIQYKYANNSTGFTLAIRPFFFRFHHHFGVVNGNSFHLTSFRRSTNVNAITTTCGSRRVCVPYRLSYHHLSIQHNVTSHLVSTRTSHFPFSHNGRTIYREGKRYDLCGGVSFIRIQRNFRIFRHFRSMQHFAHPFDCTRRFEILLFASGRGLFTFHHRPFHCFLIPLRGEADHIGRG